MKSQHQVILSIGSNLGNRLENIERSLELIHQEVGTIIKVSRLYETPAWVLKVMLLQPGFAYFLIGSKVLSQVLKSKSDWVVCEIKYKNTNRVPLILI
jgi:hypothetical protein